MHSLRQIVPACCLACLSSFACAPEERRNAALDAPPIALGATTYAAPSADAAISLSVHADADPSALMVRVQSGWLAGAVSGQTRTFLGVPYARPPLGALRFRPAEQPDHWDGVRSADDDGPECPYNGSLNMSEDCLTLNVFAPTSLPRGPAPVMVWIHGGGLHMLSKSLFRSQPAGLDGAMGLVEAGGVILVTINYRLGALAQFVHTDLDQELGQPSGNLSIRDQLAALRWVHDNIAAFGGDPSRVTVFGQSAGGDATCMLMFASGARDLAQRYIVESGGCSAGTLSQQDRTSIAAESGDVIARLCPGASDPVACLRGVAYDQFIEPHIRDWLPYVDGVLFEAPPLELAKQPGRLRAPLIVGSTKDEARIMPLFELPTIDTIAELKDQLMHPTPIYRFAHDELEAEAVLARYQPASDADANTAYQHIMNDEMFHCPARLLARSVASAGAPVYLYSFEVLPAVHQQDVDYVFGYPLTSLLFPTEAPIPLLEAPMRAMQAAWTSFAWSGKPEGPPATQWPEYDQASDRNIVFAADISQGQGLYRDDCDFWDEMYAQRATRAEAPDGNQSGR